MWKTVSNLASSLAPAGAHWWAFGIVNLAALILAFVPLFNLVGYESAAFFGVVLGLLATGLTVNAVRAGAVEPPLAPQRKERPIRDFGALAVAHLGLAVGPLVILSMNAVRVPNCDWSAGFAFWGLIVVPAVLIGQTAGWLAAAIFDGRRFAPWVAAFLLPLGDTAALLHHLATQPPIVGHHWFMGYFGGSIYDEALAVPPSLIAYRALHVLAIVAVLAWLSAVFDLRRNRLPPWALAVGLISTVAFCGGFSQRADFGISIDGEYIAQELGQVVETEHFVIHYPDDRFHLGRIDEIVDDHEFRYHQLRAFFGTDPVAESGRKVRSFVYADRDSKGRLMGGRDTMVAKLWLHEMHILWSGPGDHMLTHELAHIFTEPFGAGPLRLSMQRGIGVNMGLVEGAAAAAEWRARELTPHEASAAMRQLEIAPDLRRILGAGGFWTEASGPAYTAMGSFVRFLIDEEGIDSFRQAYGRGDFADAYGVEVEELIRRWERFVDEIELTDRQRAVARYVYDRRSIFGRDCARALAEVRRQARSASSRGALDAARRHYRSYLADEAGHPGVIRELAAVLAQLEAFDEALDLLDEGRRNGELARVDDAHFLELEGDIHWLSGDGDKAADFYRRALQLGVPLDRERGLILKVALAEVNDEMGRLVLVETISGVERIYHLSQWRLDEPDDPVADYLMGRRLWQDGNYQLAIPVLQGARDRMGSEVLDGELARMLGQSYYFAGRFAESRRVFEGIANSPVTRYREAARTWLERLDWAELEE